MQQSGGRRIKRALHIDMNSIRFCNEEMIKRFSKIQYISEYVETKRTELAEYNRTANVDNSSLANGRRMRGSAQIGVEIQHKAWAVPSGLSRQPGPILRVSMKW